MTSGPGTTAGGSGPAQSRWRTPRVWPLRTKLVLAMLALFAVITIATGSATVLTLRHQLVSQIDQQLVESVQRLSGAAGAPGSGGSGGSGGGRSIVVCRSTTSSADRGGPGQEGLGAIISGSQGCGQATDATGVMQTLGSDQLTLLNNAGIGSEPKAVALGGSWGRYEVVSAPSTSGTVVVGLPLNYADNTTRNMALFAIGTTLVGLGAVGAAGAYVVRRSLRPLDRVAATATRVSQLPLASGTVDLSERVPAPDSDTRTEVGQVGAAFNGMLDHITGALVAREQSERRVRQFVADASHELRTPLASIRGYAELSRREQEPVPASVQHALSRIESEGMRMSSLVEDLLLLARLDAGRPLERKPVDLTLMAVDIVSDAHAASPDHSWHLDLPDDPVEVVGDGPRLHQVLANLLANARTHTPAGTTVTTSLRVEEPTRPGLPSRPDAPQIPFSPHGFAVISVHDNGPGIPMALQPNVFQRFARGDSSRNRAAGSTGLGLSIVAAVVEAHHGVVTLSSSPGDTTFTVRLPLG